MPPKEAEEKSPEPKLTGKYDLLERFDRNRRYKSLIETTNMNDTFLHLIKDIPGKHSTKDNDALWSLLFANDQPVEITDFDDDTIRNSFKFKPNIVVPDFDGSVFSGSYEQPTAFSSPSSTPSIAPIKLKLTFGAGGSGTKAKTTPKP